MLKKENRLSADKDFGRVFKGSRPVHTQNLIFRVAKQKGTQRPQNSSTESTQKGEKSKFVYSQDSYIRSKSEAASRFGFVISNKISKLATKRNALKRQLRAIIEQEMPNVKAGYDVVIMVKLDFKYPCKQDEIREQVKVGLKKMDLYTKDAN